MHIANRSSGPRHNTTDESSQLTYCQLCLNESACVPSLVHCTHLYCADHYCDCEAHQKEAIKTRKKRRRRNTPGAIFDLDIRTTTTAIEHVQYFKRSEQRSYYRVSKSTKFSSCFTDEHILVSFTATLQYYLNQICDVKSVETRTLSSVCIPVVTYLFQHNAKSFEASSAFFESP